MMMAADQFVQTAKSNSNSANVTLALVVPQAKPENK